MIVCNIWVISSTSGSVYHSAEEIPFNHVALVLGTSKYSRSGHSNLFFKYRMEAASKLYKARKVKHFILSGDNSLSYYNEPQDMRKALLRAGIPDSAITPDYAGFRTFDSVVRSKKIFRQDSITIITQEFHAYRALFISNFYGIKAIAFATEPVPKGYSFMTHLREWFARCVAITDLYILRREPKFLGEQIDINN
ncbi:MAG: vancomycin high temperature exclusion protein [Cytophagaceae bacterium]